jgi:hypothetical protein
MTQSMTCHSLPAKVFGDPNQDGNSFNDRLPGYGPNATRFSVLTMPPPTSG